MTVLKLTGALRQSRDFEQGARAALSLILPRLEALLPGAIALRGMTHLRPGGVYRGLYTPTLQVSLACCRSTAGCCRLHYRLFQPPAVSGLRRGGPLPLR